MANIDYYYFIIAFIMSFTHHRFFSRRWKALTPVNFLLHMAVLALATYVFLTKRWHGWTGH